MAYSGTFSPATMMAMLMGRAGDGLLPQEPKKLKCPVCNAEHDYKMASAGKPVDQRCSHDARFMFISSSCPICLEENMDPPMVGLDCGHMVCIDDFKRLGGRVGEEASKTPQAVLAEEREVARQELAESGDGPAGDELLHHMLETLMVGGGVLPVMMAGGPSPDMQANMQAAAAQMFGPEAAMQMLGGGAMGMPFYQGQDDEDEYDEDEYDEDDDEDYSDEDDESDDDLPMLLNQDGSTFSTGPADDTNGAPAIAGANAPPANVQAKNNSNNINNDVDEEDALPALLPSHGQLAESSDDEDSVHLRDQGGASGREDEDDDGPPPLVMRNTNTNSNANEDVDSERSDDDPDIPELMARHVDDNSSSSSSSNTDSNSDANIPDLNHTRTGAETDSRGRGNNPNGDDSSDNSDDSDEIPDLLPPGLSRRDDGSSASGGQDDSGPDTSNSDDDSLPDFVPTQNTANVARAPRKSREVRLAEATGNAQKMKVKDLKKELRKRGISINSVEKVDYTKAYAEAVVREELDDLEDSDFEDQEEETVVDIFANLPILVPAKELPPNGAWILTPSTTDDNKQVLQYAYDDDSCVQTNSFGEFVQGTQLIPSSDGSVWVHTSPPEAGLNSWEVCQIDPIFKMKLFDIEKRAQIVSDGRFGYWALIPNDKEDLHSEQKLVCITNSFDLEGTTVREDIPPDSSLFTNKAGGVWLHVPRDGTCSVSIRPGLWFFTKTESALVMREFDDAAKITCDASRLNLMVLSAGDVGKSTLIRISENGDRDYQKLDIDFEDVQAIVDDGEEGVYVHCKRNSQWRLCRVGVQGNLVQNACNCPKNCKFTSDTMGGVWIWKKVGKSGGRSLLHFDGKGNTLERQGRFPTASYMGGM